MKYTNTHFPPNVHMFSLRHGRVGGDRAFRAKFMAGPQISLLGLQSLLPQGTPPGAGPGVSLPHTVLPLASYD